LTPTTFMPNAFILAAMDLPTFPRPITQAFFPQRATPGGVYTFP